VGAGAKAAADTMSDARMSFMFRVYAVRIYVGFEVEEVVGNLRKRWKGEGKKKNQFAHFLNKPSSLSDV